MKSKILFLKLKTYKKKKKKTNFAQTIYIKKLIKSLGTFQTLGLLGCGTGRFLSGGGGRCLGGGLRWRCWDLLAILQWVPAGYGRWWVGGVRVGPPSDGFGGRGNEAGRGVFALQFLVDGSVLGDFLSVEMTREN